MKFISWFSFRTQSLMRIKHRASKLLKGRRNTDYEISGICQSSLIPSGWRLWLCRGWEQSLEGGACLCTGRERVHEEGKANLEENIHTTATFSCVKAKCKWGIDQALKSQIQKKLYINMYVCKYMYIHRDTYVTDNSQTLYHIYTSVQNLFKVPGCLSSLYSTLIHSGLCPYRQMGILKPQDTMMLLEASDPHRLGGWAFLCVSLMSQFLSWSCYFCCEAFSNSLAWNLLALLALPIRALNLVQYLGLSYLFLVIEFQMHLYSAGAESVEWIRWLLEANWGW
jgi:hypothetical protein